MKAGGVVCIVLGVAIIALAIGAAMSGEPASKTDQGAMAMTFATLLGVLMIVGGANTIQKAKKAASTPPPPAPQVPPPPPAKSCPSCGKPVAEDYAVCGYCARPLVAKCGSCGREIRPDFRVCPYCGKTPAATAPS